MPLRTRVDDTTFSARWYGRTNNNNWVSIGGGTELCPASVTADYPNWDWRARIRRGEDCTTTMYGTRTGFARGVPSRTANFTNPRRRLTAMIDEASACMEWYTWSNPTVKYVERIKGPVLAGGLIVPTDTTLIHQVDRQALTGFHRKLQRARRDVQSLVALGELGETIRMLRSPLATMRRRLSGYVETVTDRVRRVRYVRGYNPRRNEPDLLRVASDSWLEYSFGAAPLYNDIHGLCEALAETMYHRPPRKTVSYTAHGYTDYTLPGLGGTIDYQGIRIQRSKMVRGHTVVVKYRGSLGLDQRELGDRFGITSDFRTNVIPTIYELIPYSWLVDYFTNLGAIVDAACTNNGDILWKNRTIVQFSTAYWANCVFSIEGSPPSIYSTTWRERSPGSEVYKFLRTVSRESYNGQMFPTFSVTIPHRLSQYMNMSAILLASQNLRRLVRNG
jgi:hypothetical protein